MTLLLREQLDVIDRMLSGPGGGDLWLVLSALRGPDTPDHDYFKKATYTIPIRRAAFPLTATTGRASLGTARKFADFGTSAEDTLNLPGSAGPSHYESHIEMAVQALQRTAVDFDAH